MLALLVLGFLHRGVALQWPFDNEVFFEAVSGGLALELELQRKYRWQLEIGQSLHLAVLQR